VKNVAAAAIGGSVALEVLYETENRPGKRRMTD
jgi:hypothetical protein